MNLNNIVNLGCNQTKYFNCLEQKLHWLNLQTNPHKQKIG